MWPVSDRFLQTLARSHERRTFVEILRNGTVTDVLDSTTLPDPATGTLIQSVAGSIQVDRTAVRRSGTVNFLDISATASPAEAISLFPPLITEIRPWVGVRYWDATAADLNPYEYVPIATLVVSSVDTSNYPQVTVQGYDRMWMVGPTVGATKITSGTLIADAMKLFLGRQIPASRLDTTGIVNTEHTLPGLLYSENDNAAEKLADMAAAAGQVLFVDPMGVFTTTDEPSTTDDPVMTLAPGPLAVMMRPQHSIDASQAYNAVVFTGEGAGNTPVRGYAQDDNPDSVTYVDRVGVRPLFESSPLVTTTSQAVRAAKSRLRNVLGIPDTLSVPIIPNPALESGDVILVTDPDQGIDYPVVVDGFTVGLQASEGMVLKCRARVLR
jgi:hypothetical protein